jgi:hypothetical protein
MAVADAPITKAGEGVDGEHAMVLVSEVSPQTAESAGFGDALAERRRGLRIRQERPVKVFEPATARYFGGLTADISSTGLRIEVPAWAAVRPGKVLSVHVGLSDRGEALVNRRSMIPARVVWVDRSGEVLRGRMRVGVEFVAGIGVERGAA